jgi:hypothetical protein
MDIISQRLTHFGTNREPPSRLGSAFELGS